MDELGFISDEAMLAELLTWRAMVVPILRSTGVNTKILPALQWGVPIVLTSVAASPLRIPTTDDSVALIADSAEAFSAQLQRLHAQPELAARLASAALGHWAALLEEDKTASDLANLLSLACDVVRKPEAARPIPQPIAAAAPSELRADLSSARRVPPASKCFTGGPSRRVAHLVAVPLPGAQGAGGGSIQDGGGGGSNDDGVDGGGSNSADADGDDDNAGGDENDDGGSYGDFPPAIVVEMHSAAASEAAVFLAHAAWQAVCSHCSLRCVHSRGGQEPPRDWDILIEHEMTASPNQLATHLIAASKAMDPRPLHVVHSPAAQFPAALGMYWTRGGVLASISHSERASARLALLLEAGGFDTTRVHTLGLEPIANGTRGAGLLGATWRALLGSIGIKPTEVGPLVSKIERLRLQLLGAAPSWQGCWKDSKRRGSRPLVRAHSDTLPSRVLPPATALPISHSRMAGNAFAAAQRPRTPRGAFPVRTVAPCVPLRKASCRLAYAGVAGATLSSRIHWVSCRTQARSRRSPPEPPPELLLQGLKTRTVMTIMATVAAAVATAIIRARGLTGPRHHLHRRLLARDRHLPAMHNLQRRNRTAATLVARR